MNLSVMYEVVLKDKEFTKISHIIYEHCGINLGSGKKELVRARLAKRLRSLNIKTFSEYIDYVVNDSSGKEFSIMVDHISTNLTKFFREPTHFDYLRNELLPTLTERKRKNGQRKIRCWSAGCSSGQEPYSIAITLLENIDDSNGWDIFQNINRSAGC